MKKTIIISIFFIIFCMIYYAISQHSYTLKESHIQEQINKKTPIKIEGKRIDVYINNINVDIQDNNIRTTVDYEANTLGEYFKGIYVFNSLILYNNGEVYVTDIKDTDITIKAVESNNTRKVEGLLNKIKQNEKLNKLLNKGSEFIHQRTEDLVTERIRNHFKRKPIYVLKEESLKHSLVKLTLKELNLKNGEIELKFGL